MNIFTQRPLFGGTYYITGPSKQSVDQRLEEQSMRSSSSIGTQASGYGDKFRARLVTNDAKGNDVSTLMKLMGIPFVSSSNQEDNDRQIEQGIQSLPTTDALYKAVFGYIMLQEALGRVENIDLTA